jgi:hypothetical protein
MDISRKDTRINKPLRRFIDHTFAERVASSIVILRSAFSPHLKQVVGPLITRDHGISVERRGTRLDERALHHLHRSIATEPAGAAVVRTLQLICTGE